MRERKNLLRPYIVAKDNVSGWCVYSDGIQTLHPPKDFFFNKIIGEGDTAQNVIWFLKNGIVARD